MYNYLETMTEDIKQEIAENRAEFDAKLEAEGRDGLDMWLYDVLFISDAVTGNASGSYFCNSYKSREAVLDNVNLCREALYQFCTPAEEIGERFINEDWEYLDVSIRCYLLDQAINEVLDEMGIE